MIQTLIVEGFRFYWREKSNIWINRRISARCFNMPVLLVIDWRVCRFASVPKKANGRAAARNAKKFDAPLRKCRPTQASCSPAMIAPEAIRSRLDPQFSIAARPDTRCRAKVCAHVKWMQHGPASHRLVIVRYFGSQLGINRNYEWLQSFFKFRHGLWPSAGHSEWTVAANKQQHALRQHGRVRVSNRISVDGCSASHLSRERDVEQWCTELWADSMRSTRVGGSTSAADGQRMDDRSSRSFWMWFWTRVGRTRRSGVRTNRPMEFRSRSVLPSGRLWTTAGSSGRARSTVKRQHHFRQCRAVQLLVRVPNDWRSTAPMSSQRRVEWDSSSMSSAKCDQRTGS